MHYKIYKKQTIHWDGSDETAGHFGCGDYVDVKWNLVTEFTAKDMQEAKKIVRRIFKERLWTCFFSRTRINILIEEIEEK